MAKSVDMFQKSLKMLKIVKSSKIEKLPKHLIAIEHFSYF
jgi:hypothetical protein